MLCAVRFVLSIVIFRNAVMRVFYRKGRNGYGYDMTGIQDIFIMLKNNYIIVKLT